jgi:hypothetical protein
MGIGPTRRDKYQPGQHPTSLGNDSILSVAQPHNRNARLSTYRFDHSLSPHGRNVALVHAGRSLALIPIFALFLDNSRVLIIKDVHFWTSIFIIDLRYIKYVKNAEIVAYAMRSYASQVPKARGQAVPMKIIELKN